MKHDFDSPPMFGELGGLPVSTAAGKHGPRHGNTATITGSASYLASPTFVIDASRRQHHHQDQLGAVPPGREPRHRLPRPAGHEWRRTSLRRLAAVRRHQLLDARRSRLRTARPYIDDNWQYQFTSNATWTQGRHAIKFGGDIVRQALNRFETGAPLRQLHVHGGTTTIRGGASPNQFNNFAAFLLGLPTTVSRSIIPFENNFTRSRNWQFSTFVKDSGRCRAS